MYESSEVVSSNLRPLRGGYAGVGGGIRPYRRCGAARWHDDAAARPRHADGRETISEPRRHDPQLCRRGDAVEQLAELRGKCRRTVRGRRARRSEEHTSELQSLMRISYAVF